MRRTSALAYALLLRISENWTIRISYLFMPSEIMSDVRSVIQSDVSAAVVCTIRHFFSSVVPATHTFT